ncbi:MAG: serine protein kinase RIO [Nitrososphaerales archaeon]
MSDLREVDSEAVERALRRLRRYDRESRFLVKRSEDYQVLEEVFDRPTLLTLHSMMNSKIFRYLNGVVSSGKEARIYWGVREDGSDVAVKIYLTVSAEFRRRLPYIVGDPRFKRVKKNIKSLVNLWARKEYRNLKSANDAGVPCPEPQAVEKNVLVMEFIGEEGKSAPILSEVDVNRQDYTKTLSMIRKLYRNARLVHADLSEYNIFKDRGRLILFDFGSAVDLAHPHAEDFLVRDITNINRFFSRRDVDVLSLEETLKRVKGNKF